MATTSPVGRMMRSCVVSGLLILAVSGCAMLQPAVTQSTQINPDRVQAASDALQARLQLIVVQTQGKLGG